MAFFAPSLFCACPAELQVGFVSSEYSLGEGTEVSICVLLEGYVERSIDDIYVNGEWNEMKYSCTLKHLLIVDTFCSFSSEIHYWWCQ